MPLVAWIGAGVFVLGYALIAFEQKFNTHKSAIALMMAGALWVLAAILGHNSEAFVAITNETAVNVFSIAAFSLASMALIEILAHYRFFDFIRTKLAKLKITERGQFVLLLALCFMLSGVLDNISLTICFILIARRFFTGRNLILAASGIVIAANAGGAWSPIGDVTSLLLWLSGKISAIDMITTAFIPTLVLTVVAGAFLYRKLRDDEFVKLDTEDDAITLSLSEKLVIGSALFAFVLPLLANMINVQPYTARLFGLGITWAIIEIVRHKSRKPRQSHLTANIEKIIQSVDLSSIMFIIGILLSVGALTSLGVLAYFSEVAVGPQPSEGWLIALSSILGLLSGVVDNSALVAIAIEVFPITDPRIWGLVSITAGTGGSLLIFASAAGIVAMGSLKELTFQAYLKLASLPALVGLFAAIITWMIQYFLFWK
ncbi:MAG TPA: sodium:proton antiporter NhaD [Verrucomicrobiae bacterium]|nr:sodium:proton antiporter NhaD [Verrucomicrobiae bacterium]